MNERSESSKFTLQLTLFINYTSHDIKHNPPQRALIPSLASSLFHLFSSHIAPQCLKALYDCIAPQYHHQFSSPLPFVCHCPSALRPSDPPTTSFLFSTTSIVVG